jgi:molybdopterin molybdotransferase
MPRMSEVLKMAEVDAAIDRVLAVVKPGPTVRIRLEDALGRVLAAPVVCDIDYPPFDKAMMDGYALRAADSAAGARLAVVAQIAAGQNSDCRLESGEAAQINTGAPMPSGADAVIPVEHTATLSGEIVELTTAVPAGKHVDPRAKYVSAGQTVLDPGVRLGPVDIAVAASAGAVELTVYRRPRVAVLGTGEELVDVSAIPVAGQIRNSNSHMMCALVRSHGAEAIDLGVVGDDKKALAEAIERGLEADFLCTSGGISMGAFDFVPEVLEDLGVMFHVRKIAMKPGKPTIFGEGPSSNYVFALPGNPLSTFVAFKLLAEPALNAWEGCANPIRTTITVTALGDVPRTKDRRSYWPARLTADGAGTLLAERLAWHGSGDLFGFSGANALITQPPNAAACSSGDPVTVYPLERI